MDLQTALAALAIVAAGAYLVRSGWRTLSPQGDGCGGGCGCNSQPPPERERLITLATTRLEKKA